MDENLPRTLLEMNVSYHFYCHQSRIRDVSHYFPYTLFTFMVNHLS
jgi:hypothetical protein